MSTAYERLLSHMSDKKIGFWSNREEQAICMDFPGIVGMYRVFVRVRPEENQFDVSGQVRINVWEGCRESVAETVERANYGMAGGTLEMSFEDRELRFFVSEEFSDDDSDRDIVDRLIDATRIALDTYLQTILSVIYGNELPEDAIRYGLTGHRGQ